MILTSVNLQVLIGQGSHPQKVKVFGPGVERTGLKANEPTHFTVDCTDAGEGKGRLGYCGIRMSGHARDWGGYVLFHAGFPCFVENLWEEEQCSECDVLHQLT